MREISTKGTNFQELIDRVIRTDSEAHKRSNGALPWSLTSEGLAACHDVEPRPFEAKSRPPETAKAAPPANRLGVLTPPLRTRVP